VGFTSALSDILMIGGVVACVGSVCAFALVRGSDFVTAGEAPPVAPEPEQPAGALAS
jgi:hypothetical protein